jgi:hypothetical protein
METVCFSETLASTYESARHQNPKEQHRRHRRLENPKLLTHETLHAQNDKTNGSIEFEQPYPVVAADALLQIGTAVISAVLSLNDHLSQTTFPVSRNFVTSQYIFVLFGTSLSGYALLNASRTAANDLDSK